MTGTVVAACTILTGSTGLRGLVEDPPPVRSITADGCRTVTTLLSVVYKSLVSVTLEHSLQIETASHQPFFRHPNNFGCLFYKAFGLYLDHLQSFIILSEIWRTRITLLP